MHDFLVNVRGAERVFLEMCDLYPQADVFTPVYDPRGTHGALAGRAVHTSFLQRLRPTTRTFRALLPFYPAAIESFDLTGYDLVISSSSAWAHAVICDERSTHVCYCHNPFRYAWNERHRTLGQRRDPLSRAALGVLFRRWRSWDWIAAQRVDRYLTNSRTTQARIASYFGRESKVVHPPVAIDRFSPGQVGEHYIVLSELVFHKRIEHAIEAFTRLGLPLMVVGDGPDRRRLRALAGPTVTFEGRVSDARVAELLRTSRALVMTGIEEFGIVSVEAQASGRPVIAAGAGGALETVKDGVTGRLWSGGTEELMAAVREFDPLAVDPGACVENAARFDRDSFRRTLPREVEAALSEKGGREPRHLPVRPAPRRRRGLARPL